MLIFNRSNFRASGLGYLLISTIMFSTCNIAPKEREDKVVKTKNAAALSFEEGGESGQDSGMPTPGSPLPSAEPGCEEINQAFVMKCFTVAETAFNDAIKKPGANLAAIEKTFREAMTACYALQVELAKDCLNINPCDYLRTIHEANRNNACAACIIEDGKVTYPRSIGCIKMVDVYNGSYDAYKGHIPKCPAYQVDVAPGELCPRKPSPTADVSPAAD